MCEYFSQRKFEDGLNYLEKQITLKEFEGALINPKNTEILSDLEKVWAFRGQACDHFDDILEYYRNQGDSEFGRDIEVLDSSLGTTHAEKAILLLMHDANLFHKCRDTLLAHVHDGVNYETYRSKKGVKAGERKFRELETKIGEYTLLSYRASGECKIEYYDFSGKLVVIINANNGSKSQRYWKDSKVNSDKIVPAIQIHIIYDSAVGVLEIASLHSSSKTLVAHIAESFGRYILGCEIDTSKTQKVYNLWKIKDEIERYGDFGFRNTDGVQISIQQLFYSHNEILRAVFKGNHSQQDFLGRIKREGVLSQGSLVKVRLVARYKEGGKVGGKFKKRAFFIEQCKTNLSHDKLDGEIREILRNSGICDFDAHDARSVFEYIIQNNGLVSIHRAEREGCCIDLLRGFVE